MTTPSSPSPSPSPASQGATPAKRRVLVVDDEVSITRLLKLNLERTGRFEVHEENAGVMAIPAARKFRPDIILMDVMMPDLGGGEVAARMREDRELSKIPLLFLTAAVKQEEVGGPVAVIGKHQYLVKPLNAREVIDVIDRTLKASAASAPGSAGSPPGSAHRGTRRG